MIGWATRTLSVKPGSDSYAGCNWKRSEICSVGRRRICDGSPTSSNLLEYKSSRSNFNLSTCKYGSNRLTGVLCVRTWQPGQLALQSWTQLNFAGTPAFNALDRLWFCNQCSQMPPASQVWRQHVRTRFQNEVTVSRRRNGGVFTFSRSFGGMFWCKWMIEFPRRLKEGH